MNIRDNFKESVWYGVVAALGSEIVVALLLWVGLLVAGCPVMGHLRWFAVVFVPPVLLIRHFAKGGYHPRVCKAAIVVLFVTFVAFMVLLFKTHSLT